MLSKTLQKSSLRNLFRQWVPVNPLKISYKLKRSFILNAYAAKIYIVLDAASLIFNMFRSKN